jgi:hypothetical protein
MGELKNKVVGYTSPYANMSKRFQEVVDKWNKDHIEIFVIIKTEWIHGDFYTTTPTFEITFWAGHETEKRFIEHTLKINKFGWTYGLSKFYQVFDGLREVLKEFAEAGNVDIY